MIEKVASSNPGRSGGRIFFSRVNFYVLTLIRCPFHPVHWHVKKKKKTVIVLKVQVAGYT